MYRRPIFLCQRRKPISCVSFPSVNKGICTNRQKNYYFLICAINFKERRKERDGRILDFSEAVDAKNKNNKNKGNNVGLQISKKSLSDFFYKINFPMRGHPKAEREDSNAAIINLHELAFMTDSGEWVPARKLIAKLIHDRKWEIPFPVIPPPTTKTKQQADYTMDDGFHVFPPKPPDVAAKEGVLV